MKKFILCLFLLVIAPASFANDRQVIMENEKINSAFYGIRYFDVGCYKKMKMPDKGYEEIYNYGIEAIPTLLEKIIFNDNYENFGPPGYIAVSMCLIEWITDDINPLDWKEICNPPLPWQAITLEERFSFFNKVVTELRNKEILDCSLNKNKIVECVKM